MRDGERAALGEFLDRFRPVLQEFARRTGIENDVWPACIEEVLEDVAIMLLRPDVELPPSIGRYLLRAMRSRYSNERRNRLRLQRRHNDATPADSTGHEEAVVASAVSSDRIRASHGPGRDHDDDAVAMAKRFAEAVTSELTEGDCLVLGWHAEYIPMRVIAEWIGISYEGTRKRLSRLHLRARRIAYAELATWTPEERRAFRNAFGIDGSVADDSTERPRGGPGGERW